MDPSLWSLVKINQPDLGGKWILGVPWDLVRNVIISRDEDDDSYMTSDARELVSTRRASHVQFHFEGFWTLPFDDFHGSFGHVTFRSLELELSFDLVSAMRRMNWALISAACGDITIKAYMDEDEFEDLDSDECTELMRTIVTNNVALDTLSVYVLYSYMNGNWLEDGWAELRVDRTALV